MRRPSKDVECWLQTPTTVGGFGLFNDNLSKNRKWIALHTKTKLIDAGEYDSWKGRALSWDELPRDGRSELSAFAVSVGLHERDGAGLANILVAKQQKKKESVFEFKEVGNYFDVGCRSYHLFSPKEISFGINLPRLQYSMDSIFCSAALTGVTDEMSVYRYFTTESNERLKRWHKLLPRWLWWDWVRNRLPSISVNWWKAAGDARGYVAKKSEAFGLLPSGRLTTGKIRRRWLQLEAYGLSLRSQVTCLGA